MSDFGLLEIFVLLLLGVVVFGGDLPKVGRKLGQVWSTLRRMFLEFKQQMDNEAIMMDEELSEMEEQARSGLEIDELTGIDYSEEAAELADSDNPENDEEETEGAQSESAPESNDPVSSDEEEPREERVENKSGSGNTPETNND